MNIKSIDLFLQVLFAFLFGVCTLLTDAGGLQSISIIGFAIVQVISFFAHANMKNVVWKETLLRRIHLIGVGVVLFIMFLGLIKPTEDKYDMSGLGVIIYALIPAAGLAFFYLIITFLEWIKIKNIQKEKPDGQ